MANVDNSQPAQLAEDTTNFFNQANGKKSSRLTATDLRSVNL